ncbi:MAG TPA: tetratricopeptide repeat protein, partial [Candidatus Polarisedimenticolia bacterium]|nr:tetratricopeptide repeat protein [Candidatus Polarisedimenticolia bacterium]
GIALGVLWFFVALAPVSNLPFGIGVMMAERLVYLPSAGLCAAAGETIAILAASAARRIGRGAPGRSWPVPGATLLVAALPAALFALVSADRTRVWRDELTLWETTCRNSPRSALAHVNLGSVHQYLGRLEDAEAAYRRAIMIAPNRPGPYYNLATVMEATDRPEDAIRMYREAIRVEPLDVKARNNLGRRLLAQGRSQEAIPVLEEALAIEPTALHAAINLGGAYLHQGDLTRADRIATDVLASRPGEPGALRLKAAIDAARRKVESPQGRAGAVAP